MQPHQQRVVDEQSELQDKLDKLDLFIASSPVYKQLNQPEQDRLVMQAIHMRDYNDVLRDRIANFKET